MSLEGWIPIAVDEEIVEWRHLPGVRFTAPFFGDTIRQNRGAPSRLTSLVETADWVAAHPGLAPSGFIFHMSRCGSTLIAQMLAAVAANRVLSEPPALDHVLRAEDPVSLRVMVSALARPLPGETRLFIKLDCWHIHRYKLIRRAFPAVPAVFLYRDPLEVLVSQMRAPGIWTVGGEGIPREQYVGELLEAILTSALEHVEQDPTLALLRYDELPSAVYRLFDVDWSAKDLQSMKAAAERDAKSPLFPFAADSISKRAAATEQARAAAARLMPLYDKLESARTRQRLTTAR